MKKWIEKLTKKGETNEITRYRMKQRRNEQMKERTNKERNKRKKWMNEPTGGPENQRKVRVRQPLSQSDWKTGRHKDERSPFTKFSSEKFLHYGFLFIRSQWFIMAKILRGRLPPLMREALAEFMATFILVVSIGSINVICILNNSIDQLYILPFTHFL